MSVLAITITALAFMKWYYWVALACAVFELGYVTFVDDITIGPGTCLLTIGLVIILLLCVYSL